MRQRIIGSENGGIVHTGAWSFSCLNSFALQSFLAF